MFNDPETLGDLQGTLETVCSTLQSICDPKELHKLKLTYLAGCLTQTHPGGNYLRHDEIVHKAQQLLDQIDKKVSETQNG